MAAPNDGPEADPNTVTTTTEGDGGPGVPEDASRDPDAPQTVRDSVAEAREALEEGMSLEDLAEEGPPAEPPEAPEEEGPELEAEEEEPAPEEEPEEIDKPHLQIPEDEQLPQDFLEESGYSYDDFGRLHAPNGDFVSLQRHEELRQEAVGLEAGEELEPEDELEEEEAPEEEPEEERETEEVDPELVVEIPGRGPDDDPERVAAPDKQTADALRRLRNGYMRGEDFNRKAEALEDQRQELQEFETQLRADPAGTVLEVAPDDVKTQMATRLLEDDEVYEHVRSLIEDWRMNDHKRRADIYEAKEKSRERRSEVTRDTRIRRKAREGARNARQAVEGLLPEGISDTAARKLLEEGMGDLGEHMVETGNYDPTTEDARDVLRETGTLELFRQIGGGSGERSSEEGEASESASTRRVRRVEPGSEEAEKARRTSEELEEKAEKRRGAAATPQGAGGAAATPVSPPEGQSVEERIEWVRERGGLDAVTAGQ